MISDFKVSLTCPECGTSGGVNWKDLRGAVRCPKCCCEFLLNRSCQWQSLADMPQVHYTCPRCKQSGSLPAIVAVRQAECVACGLPLVRGPDQRLHEVEEVRHMQQAAALEAKKPPVNRSAKMNGTGGPGRFGAVRVASAVLLVAGLIGTAAMAALHRFDCSPERRARAFTYSCLAGDWDLAQTYLKEDDLQRAEFARWRTRYFPSILDEHRPAGDTVRVTVETISQSQQTRVLRVTMTSRFIGTRSHEQRWQNDGNRWHFDAVTTIRAQDRVP